MNDHDFQNASNLAYLRGSRAILELVKFTDAQRRDQVEKIGLDMDAMIDKLYWEATK